jgi:hypothetical protein
VGCKFAYIAYDGRNSNDKPIRKDSKKVVEIMNMMILIFVFDYYLQKQEGEYDIIL